MEEIKEQPEVTKKAKKPKTFRRGVLTGVLCSLLVMALILGGLVFALRGSLGTLADLNLSKLQYISTLVHHYYYEEVDEEALAEGIYKGYMEGLDDPYSVYYTAQEYEDMMIDTTGNYAGIGAVLTKDTTTGQVRIVNVYDDSPAAKAGLQADDIIVSVDGHKGQSEDLDQFVHYVRGEEGTKITVQYERDGKTDVMEVTRAQVEVPSVKYKMLDDAVGYVYLSEFSDNTKDQFEAAMADLESQGMKAVIYDLRFNGGGLVDSVTGILDDILPAGTTVYMEDKNGERTTYTSDDEKQINMPMVVLTSGNTASAAEIFAGAIRDFDYGTLIGTKTFGKGIVQTTVPLSDGSAIKVTMATYYTPSGECIHKTGITPDIELEYQFLGGDDETYDESLDNQIQKGLEVLHEELDK